MQRQHQPAFEQNAKSPDQVVRECEEKVDALLSHCLVLRQGGAFRAAGVLEDQLMQALARLRGLRAAQREGLQQPN